MTAPEPLTFHGVPIVFDDPSLPECGICHNHRPLPYVVEDGLFILEGEPLVAPICQQCRDWLLS